MLSLKTQVSVVLFIEKNINTCLTIYIKVKIIRTQKKLMQILRLALTKVL